MGVESFMRIRINGLLSENELEIIRRSGADEIGIFVGQLFRSPLFILPSTAARFVHLMPPGITPVLETHLSDSGEILELIRKTGIYTVNLHCWLPDEVLKLRDKLPHYAKIILTCHLEAVNRPVGLLDPIYPAVDAVSLNCTDPEPDAAPASAGYPNWESAARLLQRIPVPCYLAGGICRENAAVGIETVKPYGIEADGEILRESGVLDGKACRDFVDQARSAAIDTGA